MVSLGRTMWRTIDTAPHDRGILLRKDFPGKPWPCIVMGEVTIFRGQVIHMWKGAYNETVEIYTDEYDPHWDGQFTHWCELN